jgi:predicted ATP-grasp superfamily ATP-dependent carboligase
LTAETVLIAALSGRGLAASARRAGFLPLVADAFADTDTRQLAAEVRPIADAARIGLRAKPVFAALQELAAAAASPPIGLILGSGFEDRPKLIAALARRYRLIGNDAATVARSKDPTALGALLDALAIAHPETRASAPDDTRDWLSKRIGGSGGTHIVAAAPGERSVKRYFQRRLAGEPLSALAIATRSAAGLVGISRQWVVGSGPRPYRYGGAVGPLRLAPATEAAVRAAVDKVSAALGLVGLVAFDFLLAGDALYLLEVNPRPSATLDVFDDAAGSLFRAHLAACAGHTPQLPAVQGPRAAAILYAEPGSLRVGEQPWPAWTADRPAPGTRIPRYRPIATVFSVGETPEEAFRSCRGRLDELGEMLYAQAPNRERSTNAEIHRSRPERLGARRQAR